MSETTEFEVIHNDEYCITANGPRDAAWAEVMHYVACYCTEGDVQIYEVSRRLCVIPPLNELEAEKAVETVSA